MFHSLLKEFSGNYAATEVYNDEEINDAIIRHEGDNIPGFPSVDVLIALLQPQLARINGPVMDCISDVYGYLENLAHKIIERVFYRFP
eukprot:CAMPEP_0168313818 /NCGR_PEP_ID=MMETSP0210-20121227/4606_1 /TAXON_ID=40633 /ORGANISM="Condylostoma magnum, Strain COL2" /LENGTH=87 /DNA_ID=CAMNT_0008275325 /DNA_START=1125 /DNA_END=1388 /DNA_ORIENTATION=+